MYVETIEFVQAHSVKRTFDIFRRDTVTGYVKVEASVFKNRTISDGDRSIWCIYIGFTFGMSIEELHKGGE